MALKLTGQLGELERLETKKALLDFSIKETEASRKLGSDFGSEAVRAVEGKAVNTESLKNLLASIKAGESFLPESCDFNSFPN